jgi:hypothetical protein
VQYLVEDQPGTRALTGQPIDIHTYPDGRVELRAHGDILAYATLEIPRLNKATDVDAKTLHYVVDKKVRSRHYRDNQTAAVIAQGVGSAKKTSAQKRI